MRRTTASNLFPLEGQHAERRGNSTPPRPSGSRAQTSSVAAASPSTSAPPALLLLLLLLPELAARSRAQFIEAQDSARRPVSSRQRWPAPMVVAGPLVALLEGERVRVRW